MKEEFEFVWCFYFETVDIAIIWTHLGIAGIRWRIIRRTRHLGIPGNADRAFGASPPSMTKSSKYRN